MADDAMQNEFGHQDQLRAEMMKELTKVLSPEELDELRMRSAPTAGVLRRETQYLNLKPEEFKLLVETREERGAANGEIGNLMNRTAATEQFRKLFGDARAEEFNRVSDLFYITTRGAQSRRRSFRWSWLTRHGKSRAIPAMPPRKSRGTVQMPVDERTSHLQDLQKQANARLTDLLGAGPSHNVRRDLGVVFDTSRRNLSREAILQLSVALNVVLLVWVRVAIRR